MHEPEDVRVVGLGQACVDVLGRIPFYPPEDTKVEMEAFRIQCGGPASTAMVALARMGIETAFLGSLSNDPFGKMARDDLLREKVDISGLRIAPQGTSQFAYIAVNAEDGQRTVFWHRGTAPPLRAQDVDLSPFGAARILHLDGLMVEASKKAADQAHQRRMCVVMDAGTMRDGSLDLIHRVDVLIASAHFADPLTGTQAPPERALESLRERGPKDVVITLGSRGSIGIGGEGLIRQPAFSVEAVDTTGAGDVYHGAYIFGLLQGWPMARCMEFASGASALACGRMGGRQGCPGLTEVTQFLRSRNAAFF